MKTSGVTYWLSLGVLIGAAIVLLVVYVWLLVIS